MTNKVAFNLQDHLRDMEGRLASQIEDVHDSVKAQNSRIAKLEADAYKLKWLWRGVTSVFALVWTWAATHILGH